MRLPSGTVTLLFADVEGSVRLWEADREAMAEASARHNGLVRGQIEAAGGQVFKTVGEAFRAAFADPSAALAAAAAIQQAAGTEPWPAGLSVRVRMALHSGTCVERDGDYVGPVVNRGAQLLAAGHGGQVLLTGATYELLAGRLPGGIGLRDLGEHRLKDLGRAERVFQVTGPGLAGGFGPLRSLDDPALRHNLPSQATSFVGRAGELAELRSLVSGESRLVTMAGPGGIGKSRLALQVAAEVLDGGGDGVWLVELAPVADPELVARTAAAVLQIREEPGRPMLGTLVDAIGVADPHSAEPGLRLAAGLRWFCNMRGRAGEVLQALSILLERPDAGVPTRARAQALTVTGHLLNHFGNDSAIPSLAGEALMIARSLADAAVAADALSQLCWFWFEQGDLPAARAQIDEAVGLARVTGDPRLIADLLGRRAVFNGEAGDLDAALADNQETLTLSRAAGDNYRIALTLGNLGLYELAAGQVQAARAHLQEASIAADNHGYPNMSVGLRANLGVVDLIDADPRSARRLFLASLDTARITGVKSAYVDGALLGLALAAGADGDPTVAATLHGAADYHCEQAGRVFADIEADLRKRDHARLRSALGAVPFDVAYRRGGTLSQADAIALAIAAAQPDPAVASAVAVPASDPATAASSAGPLSPREREIVALLAGGATDAQIAARLFLSVNTVRSHLERIRDKTGARRRTELLRYAIQVGIDPVAPPT